MAYNYDKRWLDQQQDTIKLLVQLANQQGEAIYKFASPSEQANHSSYINNVKASLSLHYPNFADVHRVIRTWKEIDRQTGEFILHVGTLNNYHAAPRMTKTHQGKKYVDIKLRGSLPTGPATTANVRSILGLQPMATAVSDEATEDETNTIEVMMDNADFVLALVSGAETTPTKQLVFKATKLTTQAVQVMMEQIPHWTVEDSTVDEQGIVTTLTLRRMEVAQ